VIRAAHIVALVAFVAVAGAAPEARADDRARAAEHFALAEAAERRDDWRAAIAEYERAYAAAPHPSVLYNIAVNYERLEEGRSAAVYFARYLDESPDARDRDQVRRRIEGLRARPSLVELRATPPDATVLVDDTARGTGTTALTLDAGSYRVYAVHGGRRSEVRTIEVGFGDPLTVHLDVHARPGVLIVSGNVPGARVEVDGEIVGYVPLSAAIPAGERAVTVSMPGYQPLERTVTIAAGGSQQLRADLARDGTVPAPPERGTYLAGMSYGLDVTASDLRYLFSLGYRTPGGRLDVGGLYGGLGGARGVALGAESRLFLSTATAARPYVRGAVLLAGASAGKQTWGEAGGGLLVISTQGPAMAIEYYIEVAMSLRLGGDAGDDDPAYAVPIIAGANLRFGR
jgi:transcriptional regulator with XRE-family HTH domain